MSKVSVPHIHYVTTAPADNTLRPRQNGRRFPDDIFTWIFLNENVWIPIKSSLKFVPNGPINNIPALVQIMAWRRPGDKPLSETMMVSLPTHICVARPQWDNPAPNGAKLSSGMVLNVDFQVSLIINDFVSPLWRHSKWPLRSREISRHF